MTADELAAVLMSYSYGGWGNEIELQDSIQSVLAGRGIPFEREVHLGRKDIIDFVAERIGIEVKLRAGLSDVTRQLHRYLQSDRLDALCFATTSRRLCALLPRELNGKRIVCAAIGGVL